MYGFQRHHNHTVSGFLRPFGFLTACPGHHTHNGTVRSHAPASSFLGDSGLISQKVIQIGVAVKDALLVLMQQFCQLVFFVVSIGGLCSIRELFFTQSSHRIIPIGNDAVSFF